MEWPNRRVDAFAGTTIVLGFGFLYVTDPISTHHWRAAIAFWIVGAFIFVCGFPAVYRKLRVVWDEAVIFYRQSAVFSPRAMPLGAVTLTVVIAALLFVSGRWWLTGGDPPSSPEDPVVRMEPDSELLFVEEDGIFPFRFVNIGPDIENVVLLFDYFVAQRAADSEITFKRIALVTCKLAPDLRSQINDGIPVKVRFGRAVLSAYQQAAAAFNGPSLLGLKVTATFQRTSDHKGFRFRWVYGCEGGGSVACLQHKGRIHYLFRLRLKTNSCCWGKFYRVLTMRNTGQN